MESARIGEAQKNVVEPVFSQLAYVVKCTET